jgi:hypothetical protein
MLTTHVVVQTYKLNNTQNAPLFCPTIVTHPHSLSPSLNISPYFLPPQPSPARLSNQNAKNYVKRHVILLF